MELYSFGPGLIEDHLEQVGVDVRPTIDLKADRTHLWDYGRWLTDKWPGVYENVVQGRSKFHISRRFAFPRKGELEGNTFELTSRGVVFIFPRRFGALSADTDLPDPKDIVPEALKKLKEVWPFCKCLRIGRVHRYIFAPQDRDALEILAERFTKVSFPNGGDLSLRINRPDGEFNRVVEIGLPEKFEVSPTGVQKPTGRAILVNVDFNNIGMSQDLPPDRVTRILRKAEEFCREDLYEFLNGGH